MTSTTATPATRNSVPTPSSSLVWPPALPNSAAPPPPPPQTLSIRVDDERGGAVSGFLHLPASLRKQGVDEGGFFQNSNAPRVDALQVDAPKVAAILLSGAGGGTIGPSSIYLTLATRLSSLVSGIPVLRLDYRYPARTRPCVADALAAMNHLQRAYQISRFVLVGWSFGGAPVFTAGAADRRVVGCVMVASQTADALQEMSELAPTPVLLLHGTGDRVLSPKCSERLWEAYGDVEGGKRVVRFFEGDDHALTGNSAEAERLIAEFILERAGVHVSTREMREVMDKTLVGEEEKVELMKRGGDLRGEERVR